MDHRICLSNWVQGTDSYHSASDYNEWTGRGGVPAIVVLKSGELAAVRKVSGSKIAKVTYPDGTKGSVNRIDINRVSLY